MKGAIGIYEYHEKEIDLDEYPDLRPQHLIAFKATENGVLAHHEDQSPEVHVVATYRIGVNLATSIALDFWEQGGHDDVAMIESPGAEPSSAPKEEWHLWLIYDMTIQQWVNAVGRFVIDSFGGVYGSEDDYQDEND